MLPWMAPRTRSSIPTGTRPRQSERSLHGLINLTHLKVSRIVSSAVVPQDPHFFTPNASTDWCQVDASWFTRLASMNVFSTTEKVHLVRLVLQQQWICDVKDNHTKRAALRELHLQIATTEHGFLIVTGSGTLAEYLEFRSGQLSTLEAGILYGYPPSAVLAFTGIIATASNQRWPTTTAQYFSGGAYSGVFDENERRAIDTQWAEIKRRAPAIAEDAEAAFRQNCERRAASVRASWSAQAVRLASIPFS